MITAARLADAIDTFGIITFEHSAVARREPRRWWVAQLTATDGHKVVGSPDGYATLTEAQIGRAQAIIDHLGGKL